MRCIFALMYWGFFGTLIACVFLSGVSLGIYTSVMYELIFEQSNLEAFVIRLGILMLCAVMLGYGIQKFFYPFANDMLQNYKLKKQFQTRRI